MVTSTDTRVRERAGETGASGGSQTILMGHAPAMQRETSVGEDGDDGEVHSAEQDVADDEADEPRLPPASSLGVLADDGEGRVHEQDADLTGISRQLSGEHAHPQLKRGRRTSSSRAIMACETAMLLV